MFGVFKVAFGPVLGCCSQAQKRGDRGQNGYMGTKTNLHTDCSKTNATNEDCFLHRISVQIPPSWLDGRQEMM